MTKLHFPCDEHPESTCGCGLRVGEMQMRGGNLCTVDDIGRLYIRAPRKSDALMARRVAATLKSADADTSKFIVENLEGLREK